MKKNTANQSVGFAVTSITTGVPVTTDVSALLSVQVFKDGAKATAGTGAFHESLSSSSGHVGQFYYLPSKTETNANYVRFVFSSTNADHFIETKEFYTDDDTAASTTSTDSDSSTAYTATDLANVRAAIINIAKRGAAEVEINGRRVKYSDPRLLQELLETMETQINADTYGGMIPVVFEEVTG